MYGSQDIEYLISTTRSDHTLELFQRACQITRQYIPDDLENTINDAVMSNLGNGSEEVIDLIVIKLQDLIRKILSYQGVWIRSDIMFRELVEIAEGVIEIIHYEDKGVIKSILDMSAPVAEKFAEIMALVTPYSIDKTLCLIERVDRGYVTVLRALQSDAEESDHEIMARVEKARQYEHWRDSQIKQEYFADRYLPHPELIGMLFEKYAHEYIPTAPDLLTASLDEIIGVLYELYALTQISKDASSEPISVLQAYVNKICPDERIVAVMQREILKINTERVQHG